MSRLIDADALIKVLKARAENEAIAGYMTAYDVTNSIIDEVEEQPTAYDVEKVVAELEEMIKPKKFYFCKYAKGGCKHLDNEAKDCLECIVELSIDIVRKGGVE